MGPSLRSWGVTCPLSGRWPPPAGQCLFAPSQLAPPPLVTLGGEGTRGGRVTVTVNVSVSHDCLVVRLLPRPRRAAGPKRQSPTCV